MKRGFTIRPEFRDDVADARDWYALDKPSVGDDFVQEVLLTIDRIKDHPGAYEEVEAGVRRAVVNRYPYGLFYEFGGHAITMLAFVNGSRGEQARPHGG